MQRTSRQQLLKEAYEHAQLQVGMLQSCSSLRVSGDSMASCPLGTPILQSLQVSAAAWPPCWQDALPVSLPAALWAQPQCNQLMALQVCSSPSFVNSIAAT